MAADGLAEDLQRLGANRIEALLVTHLLDHQVTSTAAIMEATGLRQPEVSVGMRALRERDWVRTRSIPREGKGRPMHGYERIPSRKEVLAHYRSEGQRLMDAYAQAIADLDSVAA